MAKVYKNPGQYLNADDMTALFGKDFVKDYADLKAFKQEVLAPYYERWNKLEERAAAGLARAGQAVPAGKVASLVAARGDTIILIVKDAEEAKAAKSGGKPKVATADKLAALGIVSTAPVQRRKA